MFRLSCLISLFSLIAFTPAQSAECTQRAKAAALADGCPGIYRAFRASCLRAYNAERWHYLAPDSVHAQDWAKDRRWRGYLKAELQACKRHRGTPWAMR
jgi:hypothetical protein